MAMAKMCNLDVFDSEVFDSVKKWDPLIISKTKVQNLKLMSFKLPDF